MQANSSFCFYFLFFINPVEVWGSPLSFQSRGLPNEIRVFWCPLPLRFGGGLACLGAGMLNTLKIILSWLQSRESGSPARSLTPSWGGSLWRDGDLGGGCERGARLHLRCCSACGDSGNLRRTAQPSGKVAGSLAVAVFVFWALRDSVLAPNGCSPAFLNFIFPMVQAL